MTTPAELQLPPRPSYMESLATPRRARKDRRCDSCGEVIPKGSPYVHHSLPPGSDIGNTHWMTLNACGWWTTDCRRYWVIDSRDLNGEPHVLPV